LAEVLLLLRFFLDVAVLALRFDLSRSLFMSRTAAKALMLDLNNTTTIRGLAW